MGEFLVESMARYIGQTVTIFTTSGGLSGNGFTGVLAGICGGCVRLITDIGAPPSCPIGSACCGGFPVFEGEFEGGRGGCGRGPCGGGRGRGRGRHWNWLGSVTEIPVCKIVSFTHNAI
ncbi:MAG: hypothetical protein FWD82_04615 [Defluviitaleaceae bacterium]|nr:hypothetical protein [Defluviitaleaceae bacterium]